jgi:hypothetical protein
MTQRPGLKLTPGADLRLRGQLLARVQAANLLKLSEPDMARMIREIESDPLFRKLVHPPEPGWKVLRFSPHPRTRFSSGFYELDEGALAAKAPPDVARLLEESRGLRAKIKKLGAEAFERYFLRAEEAASPAEISRELGLEEEDVRRIQDFLLSFSVHAEFFAPSAKAGPSRRVVRLARVELTPEGEAALEFLSPHLARGRYDIHYERLEALTRLPSLGKEEKRRLRALVRRLELVNWRQNALHRVLDLLCYTQRQFFATRDTLRRQLMTQRQMARRLSVAPSTVSRAIQGRSLVLPWGEEVLLEDLFCSRKTLCLDALDALEAGDPDFARKTDEQLQELLRRDIGLAVPRRTVNTYRRQIVAK